MQSPPMESRIQSRGKLRKRYLPALYLDPSFFTGYVAAAIAGGGATSIAGSGQQAVAPEEKAALDEMVRRVRTHALGVTPVVSALTILRWMQETAPRYRQSAGEGLFGNREDSDFAGLAYQSWLNRLQGGALEGLLQVDLQAFTLRVEAVWEEVPGLALLDGAEHATLHALAARHLGCTWLATARPEMARICELLQGAGGPRPLLGARELLAALAAGIGDRSRT